MTTKVASATVVALAALLACSAPAKQGAGPTTTAAATPDAGPAIEADAAPPPPPRYLLPATISSGAEGLRAASLFAIADTQLHYMFGKRTFAQSPFADRMAFEVAVRPAALDDGSDLLLDAFASDYVNHYADHGLVFLGDAADLSCEQEMANFLRVLKDRGVQALLSVASNHDGFFVGNFTSKDDLDGNLALTDMPNDWTRACSAPGSFYDNRLTKGRAVKRLAELLPEGPLWASSIAHHGAYGPDDYKASWMYYLRRLPGGDASAPPVWGIFLDTVDYRGFDLKAAKGAGSSGAVSRLQLRFLDRAMFQAAGATPGQRPTFVVFGHHPMNTLEPVSRRRVRQFFEHHEGIIGYVGAHEHAIGHRVIDLGNRKIPEIIVGSTTDSPNAATRLEVRISDQVATLVAEDLVLDPSYCAGVPQLPPTSVGYTGYRIRRDDTPDVDIGTFDKLAFAIGLSDLEDQRARQAIGALLVENELVRGLADLYLRSPLSIDARAQAQLKQVVSLRYAAGNSRAELHPYVRGAALKPTSLSDYDRWDDPVIAPIVTVAAQGLHRFGPHRELFAKLRQRRQETEASRRYFFCHAAHAAKAESLRPKTRGNVLYIR